MELFMTVYLSCIITAVDFNSWKCLSSLIASDHPTRLWLFRISRVASRARSIGTNFWRRFCGFEYGHL